MKKILLVGNGEGHIPAMENMTKSTSESIVVMLVARVVNNTVNDLSHSWPFHWLKKQVLQVKQPPVIQSSNAKIIIDELTALDVENNTAIFQSGYKLVYDFISLNNDYETDISWLATLGERLLPFNPIDRFMLQWQTFLDHLNKSDPLHLAIVIDDINVLYAAMAVCNDLDEKHISYKLNLVVSGDLRLEKESLGDRLGALCQAGRLTLHCAQAVGTNTGLLLSNGTELYADRVIAALKTRPPPWLKITELSLDSNGFIIVDSNYRSVSHKNVFASASMAASSQMLCDRTLYDHSFSGEPQLTQD